ncbi:MAG: hypothetical protein CMQ40_10840 [Gammaproteobacteria bacterium]|nr:hypothetical protein [Gammaproteobacteria bacterium]
MASAPCLFLEDDQSRTLGWLEDIRSTFQSVAEYVLEEIPGIGDLVRVDICDEVLDLDRDPYLPEAVDLFGIVSPTKFRLSLKIDGVPVYQFDPRDLEYGAFALSVQILAKGYIAGRLFKKEKTK